MRDRIADWLAKVTGAPLGSARLTVVICIWCAVMIWIANGLTTWAQTAAILASYGDASTASANRWKIKRESDAEAFKRLEGICARR